MAARALCVDKQARSMIEHRTPHHVASDLLYKLAMEREQREHHHRANMLEVRRAAGDAVVPFGVAVTASLSRGCK